MTQIRRVTMVFLSALAMLAFLFTLAALSFGRFDGVAFYLSVVIVSIAVVTKLWRRERALRRAGEELLPPEQRPVRRKPRRPITFPLVGSLIAFAIWYVVVIAIDRVLTGTIAAFTLIAVAPFAAFMLTTITVAGRHMAFRLTAEDMDEVAEPNVIARRASGPPRDPERGDTGRSPEGSTRG